MLTEPEFCSASVVVLGSLNPTIFTPDWFLRHGLISEGERDTSVLGVIHSQLAQFRTEWFELVVEQEKFSLTTRQDPRVRILDLAQRIFGEFLTHTPFRALGINRAVHFRVANKATRDKIGWTLAPPEAWGEWAPAIKGGEGAKHGGMRSITMQQRDLDDRPAGHIAATVQPSNLIESGAGIYVSINDHYQLNADASSGAGPIVELLKENFEKSQKRSDWIIDQIMKLAHV